MKHTKYLYITNPVDFSLGKDPSFFLSQFDPEIYDSDDRIFLRKVEIEIPEAIEANAKEQACKALDERESAIRAQFQTDMDRITDMRNQLLSITHQPQET